MHFHDLVIILVFNLIVILVFFIVQKRAIAKNIKHLKTEIQELEDLVAAIIEEFEDIAVPERQSESGVLEDQGRVSAVTHLGEFDDHLNLAAEDLASNFESDPYENDFGEASFISEDGMNFEAPAGEADESINFAEESAEDGRLNAMEYSPGNEFGLFKAPPNQNQKAPGKTEGIVNAEFINDPKHRRIFELWKQGLTIEEIARQLSMGRGEIQLIVGIYRRG